MVHGSCCATVHDSWFLTIHSAQFTTHGSWLVAHGSWRMAHGSWLMAHGSWLIAHGSWLAAHPVPVRGPQVCALNIISWVGAHCSYLRVVEYCLHAPFEKGGRACARSTFQRYSEKEVDLSKNVSIKMTLSCLSSYCKYYPDWGCHPLGTQGTSGLS